MLEATPSAVGPGGRALVTVAGGTHGLGTRVGRNAIRRVVTRRRDQGDCRTGRRGDRQAAGRGAGRRARGRAGRGGRGGGRHGRRCGGRHGRRRGGTRPLVDLAVAIVIALVAHFGCTRMDGCVVVVALVARGDAVAVAVVVGDVAAAHAGCCLGAIVGAAIDVVPDPIPVGVGERERAGN